MPAPTEDLVYLPELAKMIGLSEATIRSDLTRRPQRIPPRHLIPGKSTLAWRRASVLAWLEAQKM